MWELHIFGFTNALRIGRKKQKPSLLKIMLGLLQEKVAMLQNFAKLRSSDSPEDIYNVYITPDLTHKEQESNKALRSKWIRMESLQNKKWPEGNIATTMALRLIILQLLQNPRALMIITLISVSYQLIGRKSYPTFIAVKISYRTHNGLDTTSRILRTT